MSRVRRLAPIISQRGDHTCWYACAEMIVSYYQIQHQGETHSYWPGHDTLGQYSIGQPRMSRRRGVPNQTLMLTGHNVAAFARRYTLRVIRGGRPSERQLARYLLSNGPLWYGGAVRGYRGVHGTNHVVVIVGLWDGQIEVNDPDPPGRRIWMDFNVFFRSLAWIEGIPLIAAA